MSCTLIEFPLEQFAMDLVLVLYFFKYSSLLIEFMKKKTKEKM